MTITHDPSRRFIQGDLVRITEWNGRIFAAAPEVFILGNVYQVSENEHPDHFYTMIQSGCYHYAFPPCFLQLVKPADFKAFYFVRECTEEGSFDIFKKVSPDAELFRAAFFYRSEEYESCELSRDEAQALAKNECSKLNATLSL